ncbi:MAG: HAD-IA family hydrolase [Saprospiraceae bacterium]
MQWNIQLLVFDIAGTTIKDHGEVADAFQSAMDDYGYSIPREKIYPLMGYRKTDAIAQLLREFESDEQKITIEYIQGIHSRFVKTMVQYYHYTDKLEPQEHAEEIFAFYRKRDVKIGLNTGFPSEITEAIMDNLGWLKDGKIDFVVSSDEVPEGRPHPYMIHRMMELAGIHNPDHVVKIGDTSVDIEEGKNAGCLYSIAVTTGAFTHDQLKPFNPDYIIDDLKELYEIL